MGRYHASTALRGEPAMKAPMLSTNWSARICMASWLAQATCGVTIRFGSRIEQDVTLFRRLLGEHRRPRPRCRRPQRIGQGLFIDEAAAPGIDEEGAGFIAPIS